MHSIWLEDRLARMQPRCDRSSNPAVPSTGAESLSLLRGHEPPDHEGARLAGVVQRLPAQAQFVGHTERWSSATGRERWQEPPLRATVRAPCNECNSGWMAEAEYKAKPLVGPMIRGLAVDLGPDAQEIVANWVAVKGLVAAQTSKVKQPIPERHYGRVHDFQGAPPNTMRVRIGQWWNLARPFRGDKTDLFDYHFMPVTNVFPRFPTSPLIQEYRSHSGVFNATIFRVGHFFALALQHDWLGLRAGPKPLTPAAGALAPIGPTRPTVHWPPPRRVDDLGDPHKLTRLLMMAPPLLPVYAP